MDISIEEICTLVWSEICVPTAVPLRDAEKVKDGIYGIIYYLLSTQC